MSLRTICDRCEKIIELGTAVAKLELHAIGVENFDLCPKCLKEFRRWMDGEITPHPSASQTPSPQGEG